MNGILPLLKPERMSSARAVAVVKRATGKLVKVGHAGTLDPFATGVLVILVGKATRCSERIMSMPKCYEAGVFLGATSATLDPESPVEPGEPLQSAPTEDDVRAALATLVGTISQQPPVYSALKIGGRPAYRMARAGQEVTLAPRQVRIDSIELLSYAFPVLKIRVHCGRGTYVRAIARDVAAALGTVGYLTELRRTAVGPYTLETCITPEQIGSADLSAMLLPAPEAEPSNPAV